MCCRETEREGTHKRKLASLDTRKCRSSIQNTQAQVDEVVDIMKDNVNKVLERDSRLTDMEDKSGMCACVCPVLLCLCVCRL